MPRPDTPPYLERLCFTPLRVTSKTCAGAVVTLPDSIFTAFTAICSCAVFAPLTPHPWPEATSVEPKSPALCKALHRNVAIVYHGSGMLVQPLDIKQEEHFSRVEQSLMRRGRFLFVVNVAALACVEQGKRLSGLFLFTLRFSTYRPISTSPSESPSPRSRGLFTFYFSLLVIPHLS